MLGTSLGTLPLSYRISFKDSYVLGRAALARFFKKQAKAPPTTYPQSTILKPPKLIKIITCRYMYHLRTKVRPTKELYD